MKVIFLDIDGVLNSREWFIKNENAIKAQRSMFDRSREQLDPAAVKLVSDLALETGADTVISSTWRRLHSLDELQRMLRECGWKARLPFDITPKTDKEFRGEEIRMWLDKWDTVCGWTCDPHPLHVIFDDDSDFLLGQPLVRTTFEFGIQEAHIDLARQFLT